MKYPLFFIFLVGIPFLGCTKNELDDTIDEKDNAVLVEKVSSINASPGRNRVKVAWAISENSGIKKCRVYWNGEQDWLEVPATAGTVDMEAIVANLEEKNYTFSVYAYDEQGNASGKVLTNGRAYGSQYGSSLVNRPIKNVVFREDDSNAIINWGNAENGTVGLEIEYTDAAAVDHVVEVSAFSASTTLNNFISGEKIVYRTLYKPTISAIDTFYTSYDTVKVISEPGEDLTDYRTMVTLDADGPGDTYQLLGSILGGSPQETPDCRHPEFGPHITEELDSDLNKNVFAFFAHVTPDDDRCGSIDRQRTEIKTYSPSPGSVKAFNGDEMIFMWKFKLAAGFKPSSSFTHIHQIKAGDGTNAGSPLITITPRYGSQNKLEIIHTGNTSGSTLGKVKIVPLVSFVGTWVEATEKIKFGTNGTYKLVLKRVSDGQVLLSYTNDNIDLWRTAATFIRPKWGIYRSLNDQARLRDEKVLFADFAIGKK